MAQNIETPQESAMKDASMKLRAFIDAFGDRSSSGYVAVKDTLLTSINASLPAITLDEFLNNCETLATLTLPVALQNNDIGKISTEIQKLSAIFSSLQIAAAQSGAAAETGGVLVSMLQQDAINAAMQQTALQLLSMQRIFMAPQRKGLVIPLGHRNLVIPFTVIAIAAAFILFLSGGLALASGRIAPSKNHDVVIVATPITLPSTGTPLSTSSAGATVTPAAQPTATSQPTPSTDATAIPATQPTATPQSAPPTRVPPTPVPPTPVPPVQMTISTTTLALCPSDETTLQYISGGTGSISWDAVSSDPSNVALRVGDTSLSNVVNGTLQRGQEVDITAQVLNDGSYSGSFVISVSTGTRYFVSYSTHC